MTPGNHEYGKGVILSPQWRPQFNLPLNGPKGLEETCYFVNYSNLKVISLDAEQIDESPFYLNTIDDNTLSSQSFTANGELYDAFDLEKRNNKPNKLINRIPDTRERL